MRLRIAHEPAPIHAAEVFGEAVDALVRGGSVRDRLHIAARFLLGITPDEFDRFPEIKMAWKDIRRRLNEIQDERNGSFLASVDAMSAAARSKLVDDIVAVDRLIRDAK